MLHAVLYCFTIDFLDGFQNSRPFQLKSKLCRSSVVVEVRASASRGGASRSSVVVEVRAVKVRASASRGGASRGGASRSSVVVEVRAVEVRAVEVRAVVVV